MSLDSLTKIARGAHALCHTTIWLDERNMNFAQRLIWWGNMLANALPCPLPKLTYWGTSVACKVAHNGDTDFMRGPQNGNTFTLIAENVARVGLIAPFPRFALGLGIAAITTRLATYAFSSQVRGAFSAIVENDLGDPLKPRSLKQLELHVCCQNLSYILKWKNTESQKIPAHLETFKQLINTPNIGIRNNIELTTADGKTVTSLGTTIIQAIEEYQKTDAQEQSPFDTQDLQTLSRLL